MMKEEKQNDLLHMFLSKMVHCGGREGVTAGAEALFSVPMCEENIAFVQLGGLLMWYGPKEYLLMAEKILKT